MSDKPIMQQPKAARLEEFNRRLALLQEGEPLPEGFSSIADWWDVMSRYFKIKTALGAMPDWVAATAGQRPVRVNAARGRAAKASKPPEEPSSGERARPRGRSYAGVPPATRPEMNPASEAQLDYIDRLLAKRDKEPLTAQERASLSKPGASELIDHFRKELGIRDRPQPKLPSRDQLDKLLRR